MTRRPTTPAAPVGQQGTSRARRCVSRGALRSARGSLLLTTGNGLHRA
jgi:hypothetical protein